jgi:hypothetical protein
MPFRGEVVISSPQTGQLNNALFNVQDCEYRFYSPTDSYGRITGRRVVGKINFVIETTPDTVQLASLFFIHGVIEGKFTFYHRDALSTMMEVEFQNARIIDMTTVFEHDGATAMLNRLTISCDTIILTSGGQTAQDTNDWEVQSEF